MKKIALLASVAAFGLIVGCASNKSSANAGAVGACDKGDACCKNKAAGSMGTVSEKKAGGCAEKSGCSEKAGSMGAVSEKSGCSAAKTECTTKQN